MTEEPTAGSSEWWRNLLRESFGPSFWSFAAIAVFASVIAYIALGPEAFHETVYRDAHRFAEFLPRVLAALMLAGFLWAMLPRAGLSRAVSRNTGLRGIVIATAAGTLTPGGPASAFSLLAILGGAGADRGIMVAYITSWALLGIQRILVWDIPLMGAEFSVVRFVICLPLPILAGLIARRLRLSVTLVDPPPQTRNAP